MNLLAQFSSPLLFFEAFLQNIIGNVISINNLSQNIQAAAAANNTALVWLDTGKMVYLFVNVKPLIMPTLMASSPIDFFKIPSEKLVPVYEEMDYLNTKHVLSNSTF